MRFAYRAVEADGRIREGEISARSRERAIRLLRRRALVPVSLSASADEADAPQSPAIRRALVEFTRGFEVLVGADIPIFRALSMLAGSATNEQVRSIAGGLLAHVQKGSTLSAAMADRPSFFPATYVGMVRAGEEGGTLAQVLGRLADLVEREAALRAKVQSALLYPLIVLFLTGITLILLLLYVIPEFRPVFEQADIELPVSTRLVLGASEIAVEIGWVLVAALVACWLLVRRATQSGTGRLARDRLALRLPLIGTLLKKIETARYCRTLGTLLENGVVLIEAAEIAAGTVGNRDLRRSTRLMTGTLKRGDGVLAAITRAGWFSSRSQQMIAVGIDSGRLGTMLLRLAEIEEAESERAIQRLVAVAAPAATVLLGCLIAFMIGSIFSAILGSYDLAV